MDPKDKDDKDDLIPQNPYSQPEPDTTSFPLDLQ